MKKVKFSNHIIICGWNFQGEKIINELLASEEKYRPNIVLLADFDIRPTSNEKVEFIKGDPTQDDALIKAGIKTANSVIILTDLSKGANEADARALMIVLAVESLNRDVHTCVQLLNSANRIHLERAHADEVVCLDQMGGNMVVAAAMNHGVSRVVADLLSFNKGSEIYRYDQPLPNYLINTEFSQAVKILSDKRMLLIGVETEKIKGFNRDEVKDSFLFATEDKITIVNPEKKYKIRQGDALFIISETEPTEL